LEEQVGLLSGITPRGKILIVVASVLFALLVVAPQSLVPSIIVLATFNTVLLLVSRIIFDLQLSIARRLGVKRRYDVPVIEYKPLSIKLEITNPSRIPLLFVEIRDSYPPLFKLLKYSNSAVASIPARGSLVLEYVVKPVAGRHVFKGPFMVLRDPAGLFSREISLGEIEEIRVQPRLEHIRERMLLAVPTLRPGGTAFTRRRGIGMQFMDIREYVPGDEYRRIEWKATARTTKLMVKEFEQESSLEVMLVLDLPGTMSYGVVGSTKLEYSLRSIASISEYLLRRGDYVGLAISSGMHTSILKPARGSQQFRRILRVLSDLSWPSPDSPSGLANLLRLAATRATKRGKTVYIVISDLEQVQPGSIDLLFRLRSLRNEVIVISPYTPLFEVKGLSGFKAALYRLYTIRSMSEREKTVKTLLAHGIPVVTVGPDDMVEATLMRIELLRQRLA